MTPLIGILLSLKMALAVIIGLSVLSVVALIAILANERFTETTTAASFPGTSYLTFTKETPSLDFNLQISFQTSDPVGGVLYTEASQGLPGSYHLCVEYGKVTFYAIKAGVSLDRYVLENSMSPGTIYTITLEVNGNTLIYKEKNLSYPLKSLLDTGSTFYVGGPELPVGNIVIPSYKGCIYHVDGPNGYVSFPPHLMGPC